MKPCWCRTITNLLLCIHVHSNDFLWSSCEGPVLRFPAKQMRPINHLLWMNGVGICRHYTFLQVEKRKGLHARNTRVYTPVRDQCSYVTMWIEVLFINFSATLRKSREIFLLLFKRSVYSKVITFLYLGHFVVILWIIIARNLSLPLPQSLILPCLSYFSSCCFLVTQTYNLSQLWFFFSYFICLSSCQVLLIHLS